MDAPLRSSHPPVLFRLRTSWRECLARRMRVPRLCHQSVHFPPTPPPPPSARRETQHRGSFLKKKLNGEERDTQFLLAFVLKSFGRWPQISARFGNSTVDFVSLQCLWTEHCGVSSPTRKGTGGGNHVFPCCQGSRMPALCFGYTQTP